MLRCLWQSFVPCWAVMWKYNHHHWCNRCKKGGLLIRDFEHCWRQSCRRRNFTWVSWPTKLRCIDTCDLVHGYIHAFIHTYTCLFSCCVFFIAFLITVEASSYACIGTEKCNNVWLIPFLIWLRWVHVYTYVSLSLRLNSGEHWIERMKWYLIFQCLNWMYFNDFQFKNVLSCI